MADKIGHFLGKITSYIFIICIIVIMSVLTAAIVNRLILWGFPHYGC